MKRLCAAVCLSCLFAAGALADDAPPAAGNAALEAEVAALREQSRKLSELVQSVLDENRRLREQTTAAPAHAEATVPPLLPAPTEPTEPSAPATEPKRSYKDGNPLAGLAIETRVAQFFTGDYEPDRGFVLVRPREPARVPFELRFDLVTQFRHTGFARDTTTWTDSTGAVQPVSNRNVFEINRNWIEFSGFAFDPNLRFYTVIFTSSASGRGIFLGWINYHFSDIFDLYCGYFKVPGAREFVDTFWDTQGVDRTMATTFFRPNLAPGIWAKGQPIDHLYYYVMVSNSFDEAQLTANRVGTNLTYSGNLRWEPFGAFGPGPSDIEMHDRPALRLGGSLTRSRENRQDSITTQVSANPENTIYRLSDGTPLFKFGALGPGCQLNVASVCVAAIDAGVKWQGLSLTGEYFFRSIDELKSRGAAPEVSSLFDHGAYAQCGWFVLPREVELYARTSYVHGHYGGGREWGGGVNWFVNRTRHWRCTFEVLQIDHSPADNILTGYRAGESGTLFQTQLLVNF